MVSLLSGLTSDNTAYYIFIFNSIKLAMTIFFKHDSDNCFVVFLLYIYKCILYIYTYTYTYIYIYIYIYIYVYTYIYIYIYIMCVCIYNYSIGSYFK